MVPDDLDASICSKRTLQLILPGNRTTTVKAVENQTITNGYGRKNFQSGASYAGEFRDGKMDGFGRYTYKGGKASYSGSWKNDKRHGFGEAIYQDGTEYVGEFQNDKYHGRGMITWPNHRVYSGHWEYGMYNGEGEYIDHNANGQKEVYNGSFKNNRKHGLGTKRYANGSIWYGMWQDGEKRKELWSIGASRPSSRLSDRSAPQLSSSTNTPTRNIKKKPGSPSISQNRKTTQSKSSEKSPRATPRRKVPTPAKGSKNEERKEDSTISSNLRQRPSTHDVEDGRLSMSMSAMALTGYDSDDGLGWGDVRYKNGGYYTGELLRNKRHGSGKFVYSNGTVYVGLWQNGKWNGDGRLTDKEHGTCYNGQFKNHKKDGMGEMTYLGGKKWFGIWRDDEKVQELKKFKFDVFMSHDWGNDEYGRDNHERVKKLTRELIKGGFSVWLDENEMRGNMLDRMTEGIDDSMLFIAFVTRQYLVKVSGKGPKRGANDNCKLEFEYARQRRGVENMVPVVMESSCKDQTTWGGAVGATLINHMYISFTTDDELSTCTEKLIEEIEDKSRKQKVETGCKGADVSTPPICLNSTKNPTIKKPRDVSPHTDEQGNMNKSVIKTEMNFPSHNSGTHKIHEDNERGEIPLPMSGSLKDGSLMGYRTTLHPNGSSSEYSTVTVEKKHLQQVSPLILPNELLLEPDGCLMHGINVSKKDVPDLVPPSPLMTNAGTANQTHSSCQQLGVSDVVPIERGKETQQNGHDHAVLNDNEAIIESQREYRKQQSRTNVIEESRFLHGKNANFPDDISKKSLQSNVCELSLMEKGDLSFLTPDVPLMYPSKSSNSNQYVNTESPYGSNDKAINNVQSKDGRQQSLTGAVQSQIIRGDEHVMYPNDEDNKSHTDDECKSYNSYDLSELTADRTQQRASDGILEQSIIHNNAVSKKLTEENTISGTKRFERSLARKEAFPPKYISTQAHTNMNLQSKDLFVQRVRSDEVVRSRLNTPQSATKSLTTDTCTGTFSSTNGRTKSSVAQRAKLGGKKSTTSVSAAASGSSNRSHTLNDIEDASKAKKSKLKPTTSIGSRSGRPPTQFTSAKKSKNRISVPHENDKSLIGSNIGPNSVSSVRSKSQKRVSKSSRQINSSKSIEMRRGENGSRRDKTYRNNQRECKLPHDHDAGEARALSMDDAGVEDNAEKIKID